jgi:Tol biopolymer transport system component
MGHLWSMRADGSDKRQLTSSSQNYDDMPSWSPDGKTIAFTRSGPAIFGDIYVVAENGGAGRLLTQLIGPLAGPQLEPSWSPDGKLIAFASSHDDTHYQIYTVWADGTRVVRRTSEANNHASPNWIVP